MSLIKLKALIRRAWDIPALKVVVRAVDRMMAREVMLFAGGAGFFGLLALVPAVLVAASVYGLLFSEDDALNQVGAHQGVQHPMAKAHTAVEMASLMTRRAAWEFDNKLPAGASSNMAKYAAAEAGIEAVDAALQAHGGSGFTEDTGLYEMYPLVRLLRTAPVNRELCLSFIGEKVMGMPRSY